MFFINRIYSWAYVAFAILIKRHNTRRKARLKYNRQYTRAMDVDENADTVECEDLLQIIRPQSLTRHSTFKFSENKNEKKVIITYIKLN